MDRDVNMTGDSIQNGILVYIPGLTRPGFIFDSISNVAKQHEKIISEQNELVNEIVTEYDMFGFELFDIQKIYFYSYSNDNPNEMTISDIEKYNEDFTQLVGNIENNHYQRKNSLLILFNPGVSEKAIYNFYGILMNIMKEKYEKIMKEKYEKIMKEKYTDTFEMHFLNNTAVVQYTGVVDINNESNVFRRTLLGTIENTKKNTDKIPTDLNLLPPWETYIGLAFQYLPDIELIETFFNDCGINYTEENNMIFIFNLEHPYNNSNEVYKILYQPPHQQLLPLKEYPWFLSFGDIDTDHQKVYDKALCFLNKYQKYKEEKKYQMNTDILNVAMITYSFIDGVNGNWYTLDVFKENYNKRIAHEENVYKTEIKKLKERLIKSVNCTPGFKRYATNNYNTCPATREIYDKNIRVLYRENEDEPEHQRCKLADKMWTLYKNHCEKKYNKKGGKSKKRGKNGKKSRKGRQSRKTRKHK